MKFGQITPPSLLFNIYYLLVLLMGTVLCVQSLSHVWHFATLWTAACQASMSMGFFRQEYWSGLPFLPPPSQPRNWTHVCCISCIAGGFFTCWAVREAPKTAQLYSFLTSFLSAFLICPRNSPGSNTGVEWVTIPFSGGWGRLGAPSMYWAPKFPLQWVSLIFFAVCFPFAIFPGVQLEPFIIPQGKADHYGLFWFKSSCPWVPTLQVVTVLFRLCIIFY